MISEFSLLTDLYQVTMSQGYWASGMADRRAVFHLFFRKAPFGGSYAVAAGLETALEWLESLEISLSDADYLASLRGNDGKALFMPEFLDHLRGVRFSLDIDAVPEGTIVMAHEPLLRVTGSLLQCQWVESALLNVINFQTLIATKASRICTAVGDGSVLEFGLRRAQGMDGSLTASRASYIGGCHATSNVLAGKRFGIPVRGTHAHSWVMSFDDELTSFEAYAKVMPNNCIFLVDTYNTIEGVRNAILVGEKLRSKGHRMVGIRLDSGDMAKLSIEARRMLNEARLHDAVIVASNDLDEAEILRMKKEGAQVDIWGVGTKLITAYDQPALGGVYKLGAIQNEHGEWVDKIKLSEQWIKVSNPGFLNTRRFYQNDSPCLDVVFSETIGPPLQATGVDIVTGTRSMEIATTSRYEDLLQSFMKGGKRVLPVEELASIRQRCSDQRMSFSEKIVAVQNPIRYAVALESRLAERKQQLVESAKRTIDT